jgi:putative MATE family efflux protein
MADISLIQNGQRMTLRQQVALTAKLALPAIMAQLSSILMQYIDASMVGRLGADQAASVGLMNSSLWLFWGVCHTATMGFSVQVAHNIGAKDYHSARSVLRQGITASFLFGTVIALIGLLLAHPLPLWLGGTGSVAKGATTYFLTFVLALPILTMNYLAGGMLRCAGNMKVSSMLNVLMCVLDVIFNFFLIFPSHHVNVGGLCLTIPGANLGIFGAALGTVGAECITAGLMMWFLCFRQPHIRLYKAERGSFRPTLGVLKKACNIALPMTAEHAILCGAQIVITLIVAPLGVVAIAANAFAVTAESLCYMPGYGISDAATTLTGQSYGAGRTDLVKRFCHITVVLGVAIMSLLGVLMYIGAPWMMQLMTPIKEISQLGAEVLRIEAWAEPMFAASIVAYGAFIGVGDTLLPAIMNFGCIWLIRIPVAAILAPTMGLHGVWIAMAVELTLRGAIFLWRMFSNKWLRTKKA